tara:strand:- start:616 stop:1170 length:555 start_codon:yes stop_codon:yes gene_type:complete
MFLPANFHKIKYNKSHNNYTLVIKENSSNKNFFSFSISSIEAKKISLANNNVFSNKLNMYDVFLDMLTMSKYKIEKIIIFSKDKKVQSQIYLKSNQKEFILDSFIVDSIILSIKSLSLIYVEDNLLIENKIYFENDQMKLIKEDKYFSIKKINTLKKTLSDLVKQEKYELAAKVRDKIKEIEKD